MDKNTSYPDDTQVPTNLNKGEHASEPEKATTKGSKPKEPAKDDAKGDGKERPTIERVESYFNSNGYRFRYNSVKNEIEFQQGKSSAWEACDERASLRLEAKLLRASFKNINRVLAVLLANSPEYDPVIDYLKNLPKWDGKDHITALASYVIIGQERREWFDLMFKKHLVRLLQCATGRRDFNKQILVLVSNQNDGKTTFTRFLCPPAWSDYYTEEIDFESKDALMTLARNLFINLDELRGMRRADINKVKAFTTKSDIKARFPFDRRETKMRRRATFFASTNNPEFLTDETGNVRWLCFEIEGIKHDNGGPDGYSQNIDINQVYAQAWHLVNTGFDGSLTREEIAKSESYNQAHTKKSIEYELILKYFKPSEKPADFKQAADIQKLLTDAPIFCRSPLPVEAIGKALKQLGYERRSRRKNGNPVYGFFLEFDPTGGIWDAET